MIVVHSLIKSKRQTAESPVSDLFRRESVEHASRRLEGRVVLALPLSTTFLAALVTGLLVLATIFLATNSFARKETVQGWLTPQDGLVRATALRGGVVEEVLVSEGDLVGPGDVIARLRLSPDLQTGDAGAALLESLARQAAADADRAAAEIASLELEETRLVRRVQDVDAELLALSQELDLLLEQVRLAQAEVDRAELLAQRGHMSDRELNARQMSLIQASQRVSALQRTMSSTANDRADLQAQIDGIPYRITAAEAVAQAAEAAFSERTTNAQADHAYVVTAQSAARVAALPVRSGQTVLSGSVLAVLVPPDQDLIAEIFIPSRAIGFVEVGQEVRLLYQAFPHQNFGVALGHVRQVSSTVIGPDEVSIPGLVIREPVFRVEAAIRSQTVQAYGETIPLQAGMLLDADIIVDRRNLVEWLFDPVFAAGRR